MNQKFKTYVYYLAQQISVGFSIDLIEGVKPMIYQKFDEFPRKIIIQEIKKIIEEAQKDISDLTL